MMIEVSLLTLAVSVTRRKLERNFKNDNDTLFPHLVLATLEFTSKNYQDDCTLLYVYIKK